MAGKKTGKRLLTWVLVLVMALSLLPLNALAANGPGMDSGSGMIFTKKLVSDAPDNDGNYTIQMTAQATGTTTTTSKAVPMDIVLVLDQSGSMKENFGSGTRQSAMKEAVNSFIGEVAAKYSTEADHHMAIVTFGSNADTLENWTAVDSDGATKLTGKISSLPEDPSGATNVGAGMQMAKDLMNDAYTGNNTDRQKTVIVFTDGVPTTEQEFNTTVANNAISAAKDMKDNGVTIYTVGIFNGAKPEQLYGDSGFDKNSDGTVGSNWSDFSFWMIGDIQNYDVPAGNRFLNYLSSNFENATGVGLKAYKKTFLDIGYRGWEITQNFKRTSSDYYLTASDASSLEKIFEGISTTVPAPGDPALNKDTVITDTLSNYFTFATGTAEDVKVSAKKSNGDTHLINLPEGPNGIDVKGKTVKVTGYDFSKHYQGIGGEDEETLVIEIKVKPSGDGCREEEIPTNADTAEKHAAKVEVKSEDGTEPTFVTSHKTAKVTGHKVIYDLDGGTGSITDKDLYYPQDAVVAVTNSVPTLEGYEFTGWKSDIEGDNNVYTSDGANSSFTMPAANVILKAQWKKIEAAEPTPATVTLTDAEGNSLINKHLTITDTEAEKFKGNENAYFCAEITPKSENAKSTLPDNQQSLYVTTAPVYSMNKTEENAREAGFAFATDENNEPLALTFSKAGTYTFTVKEVTNEYTLLENMEYDKTEYTMIVEVTENTESNVLNAAVRFTENSQTDSTNSITFNNTYKTPVYDFNLTDLGITVYKNFVSTYGCSVTRSFTATATIEKQETYIIVNPGIDNNVTNNGSAVTVEPTYTKVGEVTGTVTLETDKKPKAFDFDKDSKFPLQPGTTYCITVKETNCNDRYVKYDTTGTKPHTRYFTVSEDGVISPIDPIIITNEYTKRHTAATPSKPTLNTGDHYAYVMGYPDGTVRPNGSITRAEVSAILFRLLSDKTRDEYFTTESSFTDVKAGAWYNNSIATLEKAGVIVDTAKGGAFRPNEAITRAELAAMLAQFSDAKPVKGVKFSDVSAGHWAYEAIAIAAKMGWIEGYPDGTFRPDATITRAEMMTLVNRALERVPSDEDHLLSKRVMLTFPDCKSGDWFYIAVQEATNSHTYERAATEKNGDEQWTALRANRDWTLLEK